LSTTLR
jgi:cytoskeletal protein RodZ